MKAYECKVDRGRGGALADRAEGHLSDNHRRSRTMSTAVCIDIPHRETGNKQKEKQDHGQK